jgi:eukaryotic-like serine/threonine-protein kinase
MLSQPEQPEVGRIVDGKYRLERLLGRGGMGSVWEGVHTSLGTRFALKYIDAAFADRADVKKRFANEAVAAARLRSKHIVEVYDHGIDERGSPYIVMEFLSGEPLDAKLTREGSLSLADTAAITQQIAKALHRAHGAGIVHRDLKPENVFLVWDEEDQKTVVKVVDFGIAKFTDGSGLDTGTRTGAVLGTPHFMSPEQARGLKSVDFAADVWSLGVIAFRCVTGHAPFEGEAVGDLLVKICTLEHPAPSSFLVVPPAFDVWMPRSLAQEPRARFASVAEQAEALREIALTAEPGAQLPALSLDAPPPVNAQTAPMLEPPNMSARHADTASGVERPPRRASTTRRWLLPLLAAATLASVGAWFVSKQGAGDAIESAPGDPVASSSVSPSKPVAAVAAAESVAEVNAVPGEVASTAEPVASAAPGEPANDSAAENSGKPAGRPAGSTAPPGARPRAPGAGTAPPAQKPRAAKPEDELGY